MNTEKTRILWSHFHLYYNYSQLNSISTKHPLTPSIPQAISWVVQEHKSDKVSAFKDPRPNKSQTFRKKKKCFKTVGFLSWLLVNLIWLNDFGELIFSKPICCPCEQLTLECHKWYKRNTNKLLWELRGGKTEFPKGHLNGSSGMSRSLADIEGKGTVWHRSGKVPGLFCDFKF